MGKKRGGKRPPKVERRDRDLEDEVDHFEASDSEDGFDETERELIRNAAGRKAPPGEKEILKVYSSSEAESEEEEVGSDVDLSEDSDEDDDAGEEAVEREVEEGEDGGSADEEDSDADGVGSEMDSDLEGKEEDGLPDPKAWGKDKKNFYHTDYVDQDFLDFDNKEAALQEEEEADVIQRRLLSHLEGTDFTLGLLDTVEDKKKEAVQKTKEDILFKDEEKVQVDLSSLSKDEFIKLIKRKHPKLFPTVEKCIDRVKFLQEKVTPILELVKKKLLKRSQVIDYLENLRQVTLHYTVNVLFYIHLNELGVECGGHAVLKRLDALDLLLGEMEALRKNLDPEIEVILKKATTGEDLNGDWLPPVEPPPKNRKEKRKRKLDLLKKKEEFDKMVEMKKIKLERVQTASFEETLAAKATKPPEKPTLVFSDDESSDFSDEDLPDEKDGDLEKKEGELIDKRRVTFEMLKNKGLTPKRKKENRNPRVKHRNKYKKALVRRKGQYREPRKEEKRYGGEVSGINARVSKSVRIK